LLELNSGALRYIRCRQVTLISEEPLLHLLGYALMWAQF
jgi:hypothetical protein